MIDVLNYYKQRKDLLIRANSIIDKLVEENKALKKVHLIDLLTAVNKPIKKEYTSLEVFSILINRQPAVNLDASDIVKYALLAVKVTNILNKPAS